MEYIADQLAAVSGEPQNVTARVAEAARYIDYTYDTAPEPFPLDRAARFIREVPLKHLEDFGAQLADVLAESGLNPIAARQVRTQHDRAKNQIVACAAQLLAAETQPETNLALLWVTDKAPAPPRGYISAILSETARIQTALRPFRMANALPARNQRPVALASPIQPSGQAL